jgi:Zn-dependent oligopeptidase
MPVMGQQPGDGGNPRPAHELAQLLGFENYAFKSLATKMAENPQQVLDFLTDLETRPSAG